MGVAPYPQVSSGYLSTPLISLLYYKLVILEEIILNKGANSKQWKYKVHPFFIRNYLNFEPSKFLKSFLILFLIIWKFSLHLQAYATAKNVRKEIDEKDVRFVFHIGDISYARGYAYIWEQWGWLTEPVASLVPYMVR